jgi:hypothetical protein
MAGNWPPPPFTAGDTEGNLTRWKAWLPGNYHLLSLQATTYVPWCQRGAMIRVFEAADDGNLSPEGALELLRWCVKTSRGIIKDVHRNSRSVLGMGDVLDLSTPELIGVGSDDDLILALATHVGGCYSVVNLLKK